MNSIPQEKKQVAQEEFNADKLFEPVDIYGFILKQKKDYEYLFSLPYRKRKIINITPSVLKYKKMEKTKRLVSSWL